MELEINKLPQYISCLFYTYGTLSFFESIVFVLKSNKLYLIKQQTQLLLLLYLSKLIQQKPMLTAQAKIAIYQDFLKLQDQRLKMGLKGLLDATLDYAQHSIHAQLDKSSKKTLKKKRVELQLSQQFLFAYNQQSLLERLQSYINTVKFIKAVKANNFHHQQKQGDLSTSDAFTRSYNLKIWKRKVIKFDRKLNHLFISRHEKIKNYDLNNYLLRESKNKDFHCFVLQAINEKPPHKFKTVHIGFKDIKIYNVWFAAVKEGVIQCQRTRILKELGIEPYSFLNIDNRSEMMQNNPKLRNIESVQQLTHESPQYETKGSNGRSTLNATQRKQLSKFSSLQVRSFVESPKREDPDIILENPVQQLVRTITQCLLKSQVQGDIQQINEIQQNQTAKQIQMKRNLNIFHQILPEFELDSLTDEVGYDLVDSQGLIRILRCRQYPQKYKFFMEIQEMNMEKVFDLISNVDNYLKWNPNIGDVTLKNLIKSQNTAVIYQKNKPYSRIYLARDFVFVRHVFKNCGKLYMIDKSLQNENYPPFTTIVRGQITAVWGVFPTKDGTFVALDIQLKNNGFLNANQDHNLALMHLKGLYQISIYLTTQNFLNDGGGLRIFDLDWDIAKNQQNIIVEEVRQRTITITKQRELNRKMSLEEKKQEKAKEEVISHGQFSKKKVAQEGTPVKVSEKVEIIEARPFTQPKAKISTEQKKQVIQVIKIQPPAEEINQDQFKDYTRKQEPTEMTHNPQNTDALLPIHSLNIEQEKGEIDPDQVNRSILQTHSQIQYTFNTDGLVIIPQDFLNHSFRLECQSKTPVILQQAVNGHPIWKGQWIYDIHGGIVFANQKKIDEQKGVLKFILAKIGKNLLSGKSILNISLPVDIFSPESNLERLSFAMTYGPILLEKAAKSLDPLDKMKFAIAFGLTNSILYINMEKPFNPILGETFQGWINGCPIYMQQISHHPPIAAYMFMGRGYRVTGCLQSKVELHMNSGCGITDGVNKIRFDDGTDINFISPGGQLSGLTYGERKFNLIGKSFYWSMKHNLFLQLQFDPDRKSFFSMEKKENPSDYFEGNLCEVNPRFLQQFAKNPKKRQSPDLKDIVSQKYRVSGYWCKQLRINGQKIFDLNKDFGCKLEYEKFLLPSDGNWRQDIAYRRLMDVSKSQNQKQRLEIIQRKDRKLRQKVHKKKQ